MNADLSRVHLVVRRRLEMHRPSAGRHLDRRQAMRIRQPRPDRPPVQPLHQRVEAGLHVLDDARDDALDVGEVVRMEVDVVLGRRQRHVAQRIEALLHFALDLVGDLLARRGLGVSGHGSPTMIGTGWRSRQQTIKDPQTPTADDCEVRPLHLRLRAPSLAGRRSRRDGSPEGLRPARVAHPPGAERGHEGDDRGDRLAERGAERREPGDGGDRTAESARAKPATGRSSSGPRTAAATRSAARSSVMAPRRRPTRRSSGW